MKSDHTTRYLYILRYPCRNASGVYVSTLMPKQRVIPLLCARLDVLWP